MPPLEWRQRATFDLPVDVRDPNDGSDRLFVVEKSGKIRILRREDGTIDADPLLDLTSEVERGNHEQGLLALELSPNFAADGVLFVTYTPTTLSDGLNRLHLARFELSADDADVADPLSRVLLLQLARPSPIHQAGDLHFGPDGYLYVSIGDGGPGFDRLDRAQDPASLFGKILRLDVSGAGAVGACGDGVFYAIPAGNPFVGSPGFCPEIWALGLRNPWRFSFDRQSGDLWLGDVGQSTVEEIDWQSAGVGGQNYGWSCREGTNQVDFNPCLAQPLTEPVFVYGHAGNCAVVGGYRYRGPIPELDGYYVFGDYCGGTHVLDPSTGQLVANLLPSPGGVLTLGEDRRGGLWLGLIDGRLMELSEAGGVFRDGFELGDLTGWMRALPRGSA